VTARTCTVVFGCAVSLMVLLSACRQQSSLGGLFSGTVEIDRAFGETIPFGHQLNLPLVVRNPRSQPLTFQNFRMPTSWKRIGADQGSSGGSGATFTVDAKSACLIFCRFYIGPATDTVDAMHFTKMDFMSPVGGEHISFRRDDADIDLTVNLQFAIDGQDSGQIPLVRYRIEQNKKRAVPYWVARDLKRNLENVDLKLCDVWGQRKSIR
jgi:hypothetical protein